MSKETLEEWREESQHIAGPQKRTARPRSGLRRGLGLLARLLALAVVGVLAYNAGTSYCASNEHVRVAPS
jgi:hypothetical protein